MKSQRNSIKKSSDDEYIVCPWKSYWRGEIVGRNGGNEPWQPNDRENVSKGFSLSLVADSLLISKVTAFKKLSSRNILRLHVSERFRDVIGIPSSSEGRTPPCENSTNPLTIQRTPQSGLSTVSPRSS
jgi:hypothetical protein